MNIEKEKRTIRIEGLAVHINFSDTRSSADRGVHEESRENQRFGRRPERLYAADRRNADTAGIPVVVVVASAACAERATPTR
jgi:hypothetical protein